MIRQEKSRNLAYTRSLLHQPVVDAHQLRVVVVFQYKLSGPQLRLVAKQNLRAEVALQLIKRCSYVRVHSHFGSPRSTTGTARSQSFDLADGEAAPGSPLCVAH